MSRTLPGEIRPFLRPAVPNLIESFPHICAQLSAERRSCGGRERRGTCRQPLSRVLPIAFSDFSPPLILFIFVSARGKRNDMILAFLPVFKEPGARAASVQASLVLLGWLRIRLGQSGITVM